MVTKHTPGPWLLADSDKTFIYALNDKGTNAFFAHVQDPRTNKEELEANAHLIAAAPDMLHALRRAALVLAWASEQLGSQAIEDDYKIVSDAIEKATGVKP